MDIVSETRDYESWLGKLTPLRQEDLDYKHERMSDADDPFPFFRGTYYAWTKYWAEAAGDLQNAPKILAVGDLHLENFGNWRDVERRLCWGINDFDEAEVLPYTNDLIRLAASVRLARRTSIVDIKLREACDAVLKGYVKTLSAGGTPFVLEENHPRLREMAMSSDRDPRRFWDKLTLLLADPPIDPPAEVKNALIRDLPAEGLTPQFRFRPRVGMGSLGKPRYVALAEWNGGWVAREAKAVTPSATVWALGKLKGVSGLLHDIVRRAVRCPDPSFRPGTDWIVRRLAPRSCRIEIHHLHHAGDFPRLLRAMGSETANVHLGTPGSTHAILSDLARRPEGWLAESARRFADLVEREWTAWRSCAMPLS